MNSSVKPHYQQLNSLIVITMLTFTFIVTFVKLWDTDTFWHLKAGEIISNEKQLPQKDDFSYTKNGAEWINDEWMGDYFLFSKYQKYGFTGLQITVSLIAVLIIWVTYITCIMNGADPLVAAPFLMVAVMGARTRMTARPEIISLLLMMGVLFMISRLLTPVEIHDSENTQSKQLKFKNLELLMIPVLQVIWSNAHPGSVFSLVIIGSAMTAVFITRFANEKGWISNTSVNTSNLSAISLVFLSCFLASALNPYGLHAIKAPFDFASSKVYLKHIAEWAPIPVKEMYSLQGSPGHLAVPFFIFCGIISLFISRRKINLFHVFLFIITAAMALKSRRFAALLLLISSPYISASFTLLLKNTLNKPIARYLISALLICSLVYCGWFLGINDKALVWGRGINKATYPEHAVEFLKQNSFQGNMYNTYGLGGPLIWGLYPDYRVFSDGRVPVYGADFYNMIMLLETAPDPDKWNKLQSAFGIAFAIIKRERTAMVSSILRSEGDWKLVFWDDYVLILAKSTKENIDIINVNAYSIVSPDNALNKAREWDILSNYERETVMKELIRNLQQAPDSLQSILSLVYIYFKTENYSDAEYLALRGLEISPGQARLHAVLGEIYLEKGKRKESELHFRKAEDISKEFGKYFQKTNEQGK